MTAMHIMREKKYRKSGCTGTHVTKSKGYDKTKPKANKKKRKRTRQTGIPAWSVQATK